MKSLHKLPNVLCITETWLKPNNVNFYNIDGVNDIHSTRPEGFTDGGVYVKTTSLVYWSRTPTDVIRTWGYALLRALLKRLLTSYFLFIVLIIYIPTLMN